MTGSKDVFAKLKEYGYDLEICRALSEFMVSHGASHSILYAEGIPKLLELTGQFGPRGAEILGYVLANPSIFNVLTLSDAARGLVSLAKTEPEQIPLILYELSQYEWRHELPLTSSTIFVLDIEHVYRDKIMLKLNQGEKAKAVAMSMYLSSIPEEEANKLSKPYFESASHVGVTLDSLTRLLVANSHQIYFVLDELSSLIKKRYKELPPQKLKQIESKPNP